MRWLISHPQARSCSDCKKYYFFPGTLKRMEERPDDDPIVEEKDCVECPWRDRVELTRDNLELWNLFIRCHSSHSYKDTDGKMQREITRHTWPSSGGYLDQDSLHIKAFDIILDLYGQHNG